MTKTYDYIIVLKKPAYKFVDLMSQLMLLLAIATFIFQGTLILKQQETKQNADTSIAIFCFAISAFVAAWWFFCKNQEKRGIAPYYRFGLMLAAMGWLIMPGGKWIAAVYLVGSLLEKPVKVAPEVGFDEEEIAFNSLPQKKYSWNVVKNVVLKDGLLTIDLENNMLIQKVVDANVSAAIEKEFNEFCKQNLR